MALFVPLAFDGAQLGAPERVGALWSASLIANFPIRRAVATHLPAAALFASRRSQQMGNLAELRGICALRAAMPGLWFFNRDRRVQACALRLHDVLYKYRARCAPCVPMAQLLRAVFAFCPENPAEKI